MSQTVDTAKQSSQRAEQLLAQRKSGPCNVRCGVDAIPGRYLSSFGGQVLVELDGADGQAVASNWPATEVVPIIGVIDAALLVELKTDLEIHFLVNA